MKRIAGILKTTALVLLLPVGLFFALLMVIMSPGVKAPQHPTRPKPTQVPPPPPPPKPWPNHPPTRGIR